MRFSMPEFFFDAVVRWLDKCVIVPFRVALDEQRTLSDALNEETVLLIGLIFKTRF
jgi:hypothetical protein